MEIMAAHNQWAKRPEDEKFYSIQATYMITGRTDMSNLTKQQIDAARAYGRAMAAQEFDALYDAGGPEGAHAWTEANGDATAWRHNVCEDEGVSIQDEDSDAAYDAALEADSAAAEAWDAQRHHDEALEEYARQELKLGHALLDILDSYETTEGWLGVCDLGYDLAREKRALLEIIEARLTDKLEDELYQTKTGHLAEVVIGSRGELESQDAIVEIVVLDPDGARCAYRASTDAHDGDWQIGTTSDIAAAAAAEAAATLDGTEESEAEQAEVRRQEEENA